VVLVDVSDFGMAVDLVEAVPDLVGVVAALDASVLAVPVTLASVAGTAALDTPGCAGELSAVPVLIVVVPSLGAWVGCAAGALEGDGALLAAGVSRDTDENIILYAMKLPMPRTTTKARMPAISPSFIDDPGCGGMVVEEAGGAGGGGITLALAAMVCSAAAGDGV